MTGLQNGKSKPAMVLAESSIDWTRASLQEVLDALETDTISGLAEDTAADRLKLYGPNQVAGVPRSSAWFLLLQQFQSTVVVLLLVAAAISGVMSEYAQALTILAAVAINAAVGFATEMRAQVSLESLERLSGPTARTRRGGKEIDLPVSHLVPGDLVVLETGSRVPADIRITTSAMLSIDESSLTGESIPVLKTLKGNSDDKDSSDLLFQGTLVLDGRAEGVVVATAGNTQMGRLGKLLTETTAPTTPLQKQLDILGNQLSVLTVIICGILAIVGIVHRANIWLMLETSIALAVAAIPEGLPVVATLALALGTQRMVKAKTLIRQLSAVETLGCTTVICTDKTGTLTENAMTVTDVVYADCHLQVSGQQYSPSGEFSMSGEIIVPPHDQTLLDLLQAGALCNNARMENHEGGAEWHIHGDPTEGALLVAAAKAGLQHDLLLSEYPRIAEAPFDLSRKRMATVHNSGDETIVHVKGSPESVLAGCRWFATAEGPCPLDEQSRERFQQKNIELGSKGLRVLAIASGTVSNIKHLSDRDKLESDLTLSGLVGMLDRPKEGVQEAVANCKDAGIRVVMLTGDQPATAAAIASELDISPDDPAQTAVLTGSELDESDDEQVRRSLRQAHVLARVTPELKLKIVRSLQASGEIVAMTGDGINDAPALRQADIGVAIGKHSTELAREAANMVITDDNFSTIVRAIKQGRIIYANIRRAIGYLLTASVAPVIVIAAAILSDTGLPLLPLQILWLNLVMHIFPGLGLVLQAGDRGIMKLPPRDVREKLIGRREQIQIGIRAIVVAAAVLLALYIGAHNSPDRQRVNTIVLAAIGTSLLLQSWAWRAVGQVQNGGEKSRVFNLPLSICLAISFFMLVAAIYFPPLQTILKTAPLGGGDQLLVLCTAIGSMLVSHLITSAAASRGRVSVAANRTQ